MNPEGKEIIHKGKIFFEKGKNFFLSTYGRMKKGKFFLEKEKIFVGKTCFAKLLRACRAGNIFLNIRKKWKAEGRIDCRVSFYS